MTNFPYHSRKHLCACSLAFQYGYGFLLVSTRGGQIPNYPRPCGEKAGRNLNTRPFLPFSIQAHCTGNEQIVALKYNIVLLCAEMPQNLTGIPCISGVEIFKNK